MGMQLGIYDAPQNGSLLFDFSDKATGVTFSKNEHGDEALRCHIPLSLYQAFQLYDQAGILHVALNWNGAVLWEGRLEDIALADDGVDLTALGYWRALSDIPYSALWSTTNVKGWFPALATQPGMAAAAAPERFVIDTNNRIFMSLKKNITYASFASQARVRFDVPQQPTATRQFTGIDFAFVMLLPSGWTAELYRYDVAGSFLGAVWTLASTGVLLTGAVHGVFAATDTLVWTVYQAASSVYGGEDGDAYLKITSARVVTSTTNRVNTTLGANRAAGTTVTATVATTAGMYAGQQLVIASAAATSELVTVTSVINAVQFSATFVNSYVTGATVQAHQIYADEIAKDIVATVSGINPTQLRTATAAIQSPNLDLHDEQYDDLLPADMLTRLIGLGDNQTTPRQWEVGVQDRQLYYRPRASVGNAWYVDASSLEIERTLDQIFNSVYTVYKDSNGTAQRTTTASSSTSIARYGVTRRTALSSDTTSATQAGVHRDAALADRKLPIPRAKITFSAVYDSAGARWPLWMVRSGDTITARNLPPTLSTDIDRIRTFRISRTEYDVDNRTLSVEPESPLPTLDAMLARKAS